MAGVTGSKRLLIFGQALLFNEIGHPMVFWPSDLRNRDNFWAQSTERLLDSGMPSKTPQMVQFLLPDLMLNMHA